MREHRQGGMSALALLVGLAAGAVAALLLAPRSGEDTRRKVRDTSRRLRAKADEKLREARYVASQSAQDVRAAMSAGREAYRKARAEHADDRQAASHVLETESTTGS